MELINLTPHAINIACGNITRTIAPSGVVARVSTVSVQVGLIDGFPIYQTQYGELEGLPGPKADTMYIVSAMAAAAAKAAGRDDILSPGELIRDENGQPVGCRGLVRW